MSNIPNDAQIVEVEGATVDFFKVTNDTQSTYYFDSSNEGPPHPMVNAMCGLKLIKNTNDKLVMINHKMPGGLFSKLEADVEYISKDLDNGLVQVIFSSVNAGVDSNLDESTCQG